MARNVEIKAHCGDWEQMAARARQLADQPAQTLVQRDVFYRVAEGRLKLRFENDHSGYLVRYSRPDQDGPKLSDYDLVPQADPHALDLALSRSIGVRGVVEKERTLFLIGQTRVHLDRVTHLGHFVELEVVLRPEQSLADGEGIARELMDQLGITADDLVTGAYMDLLEAQEQGS